MNLYNKMNFNFTNVIINDIYPQKSQKYGCCNNYNKISSW